MALKYSFAGSFFRFYLLSSHDNFASLFCSSALAGILGRGTGIRAMNTTQHFCITTRTKEPHQIARSVKLDPFNLGVKGYVWDHDSMVKEEEN